MKGRVCPKNAQDESRWDESVFGRSDKEISSRDLEWNRDRIWNGENNVKRDCVHDFFWKRQVWNRHVRKVDESGSRQMWHWQSRSRARRGRRSSGACSRRRGSWRWTTRTPRTRAAASAWLICSRPTWASVAGTSAAIVVNNCNILFAIFSCLSCTHREVEHGVHGEGRVARGKGQSENVNHYY